MHTLFKKKANNTNDDDDDDVDDAASWHLTDIEMQNKGSSSRTSS